MTNTSTAFNRLEKTLGGIGIALSFGAFWFVGWLCRIPVYLHFSASLLQQPGMISMVLMTAFVYAILVLATSLIAGRIGFDAGLFCGSIGLCALSARGGPMRFTLQASAGREVWVMLVIEIALLGAIASGAWLLQCLLRHHGWLHDDSHRHVVAEIHESLDQRLLSLATNVVVTGATLCLLCQTDRKAQAIIAVGGASFFGTVVAYLLVPTRPSPWYWSAPLLVGAIGYLMQYFGKGAGWEIGEVRGALGALARPLPLDYAGSGIALAIIGYWASRRWQHERETSAVASE
jgi:hypothetical protein